MHRKTAINSNEFLDSLCAEAGNERKQDWLCPPFGQDPRRTSAVPSLLIKGTER